MKGLDYQFGRLVCNVRTEPDINVPLTIRYSPSLLLIKLRFCGNPLTELNTVDTIRHV